MFAGSHQSRCASRNVSGLPDLHLKVEDMYRALHPELKNRYKSARARTLALLMDMSVFELSRLMNEPQQSTPTVVGHLTRVAEHLGYSGKVWADE
jgi:hypothetical protein